MILEEIINELRFALKGKKITNSCVGVAFSVSLLSDGSLGISHTILDGENSLSGEIMGSEAEDVVGKLTSNPLERSVTLSILNAVSYLPSYERGDPLDHLEGNKLCLFGYSPVVETNKFSSILIYDFKNPDPQNLGKVIIKPYSSLASESCNTAVIFASALVAGYTENILKKISADHLILSGVSSVYAPSTLRSYGFEYVSKIEPLDKFRAFRTVCEGGSGRQLAKYTYKIYTKL
ncbi:Rossmann-like domain-containing protein [Stygiolobus caldivivus]|uniref:Heavy-metal chelation domain-containing protein n=1 Tax=Stygiolobus caldivivus TaxID=2824673 RepID=A0A8D5ZDW2_9CREN|nr:DUF364 domain-containing protein [Stygiolobus caldivivus]BCU69328.1 hypothetical protein KN1_06250 [Stygiolobus caldivivus]